MKIEFILIWKRKNLKYQIQQTTSCSESTIKTLSQGINKLSRIS